jgi:hypothetical protein
MSLVWAALLTLQAQPVESAVRKGVEYVRTQELREFGLWTLVTCGLTERDPTVRRLVKEMLARPVDSTPTVALQAMILRQLDPVAYRNRIAHCAQFFIDTQAADGRWSAGTAVDPVNIPPLPPPPQPRPRDFGLPQPGSIRQKIPLERRAEGPTAGDSVNSRWAAWGLLACREAGFLAPPSVLEKAEAAWRTDPGDAADVVSCLSICIYLRGGNWKKDADVLKAVERLGEPGRATDPGALFLQKRAMVHFGSEILGGREWWQEGAKALLETQNGNGSWEGVEATCAAILFLHIPMMEPPRRDLRK